MLYILLGTLTSEGRQKVADEPEIISQVSGEIDVPGTQLMARYAVLGQYDFVFMAEARDTDSVARLSVELGARGGLQFETLTATSATLLTGPPDVRTAFDSSSILSDDTDDWADPV